MNREIYPQPATLEEANAYITQLITDAALQNGRTAPSKEEIRQAFEALGSWYASQPPSAERDARALELARTLIFDFPNFISELVTAGAEDSPELQEAARLLREGKTPAEILDVLTGCLHGSN